MSYGPKFGVLARPPVDIVKPPNTIAAIATQFTIRFAFMNLSLDRLPGEKTGR